MSRPAARQTRVAFQGERGAYSEEAVRALLGEGPAVVPCPTFESLFAAVGEGRADYALAPLENTLAGDVGAALDLLAESDLSIVGEVVRRISHCLVGCPGATAGGVRVVESHPMALAQCERFFGARPEVGRVASDDTAASARRVVERGDPARAAIASTAAARLYGGVVLAERLEDDGENYTRFVLLARSAEGRAGGDKLSLAVTPAGGPGALDAALEPFARRGIDLRRVTSRPVKGRPWLCRLFLDFHVAASRGELDAALEELRGRAEGVRLLGLYPSASYGERNLTKE